MKKHLMTAAATAGLIATAFGASASAAENTYTVKPGDSLWKISQLNNVSIDQLKTWNHLLSDTIYVNQSLSLQSSVIKASQTIGNGTYTYTVKSGDSLWGIARSYGITVSELQKANGLTSDFIRTGQKLNILSSNRATASLPAAPASNGTYVVKSGDCLSVIGARFHLSIAQLKAMNHLTTDNIYAGQTLKVGNSTATTPASNVSASSTTTASTTVNTASIVGEAEKYIGVPYLWGGNTPAGFDCSGFVKYIFAKFGVSLPRTTWNQWDGTTPVGSPRVGDLVFFQTYQLGPSHVGIYVGGNKFISAASTGVTISDLTSTYWKTRYLGARSAL